MKGKATRGYSVAFGDFGLKALEPAWITQRQIEAARVALTRLMKTLLFGVTPTDVLSFTLAGGAVILVALVVLIFLQGWRAAIIPLVAVPVAIIGTFAAMVAFGFSLNTLTLFGLRAAMSCPVRLSPTWLSTEEQEAS